MVNTELARTIVGVVGNIISFFLFLSPFPTILNIRKAKSVQEFKPDPYLATFLNCALWVFYGTRFVHPGSFLVLTINGVGLVIEFFYIAIFFYYGTRAVRKKISITALIEIILFAVVLATTLLGWHSTKNRGTFVGALCIVLNIIMYASPLTVVRMVYKTKSVKYMPLPLSVANFLNGGIWATYALLKFDINVLIPNGLGVVFAILQLILYGYYYKTTDWEEAKVPVEVQLPVSQKEITPAK